VGFFAYVERAPALQQVERLVFAAVDVARRLGALGREVLYQPEPPAGLPRVGQDGEQATQIPHPGLHVRPPGVLGDPFGVDRHARAPSVGSRTLSRRVRSPLRVDPTTPRRIPQPRDL
jgi:hypothetical protein